MKQSTRGTLADCVTIGSADHRGDCCSRGVGGGGGGDGGGDPVVQPPPLSLVAFQLLLLLRGSARLHRLDVRVPFLPATGRYCPLPLAGGGDASGCGGDKAEGGRGEHCRRRRARDVEKPRLA